MSAIDFAHRTEALGNVSQALTLLEKVQIRWRRYADTSPLADSVEPVAIMLRTAKNILSRTADAHPTDIGRMLQELIEAMQRMKRDELSAAIQKIEAAHRTLSDR